LILAPNKTLAAQLYSEFKSFFPENAVEFFVSYYDYYQPEAYVPRTDTYIEKESSINEQIDRMRHSATRAILERRDTIIVASVSCIYGIGSVETYSEMTLLLEAIHEFDPLTGEKSAALEEVKIYPNSHYVTPKPTLFQAIEQMKVDLKVRLEEFRATGELPPTLFEYLPKETLIFIDESHVTIGQLHAMYRGDFSRKTILSEYGFRLPACVDNRPLKFEEWNEMRGQTTYVSATPGPWEMERTGGVFVEQVVRPTGLVDPSPIIRPVENQVDDLMAECRDAARKGQRVLVTTLTKKMAEALTEYFHENGIRVRYMHSDV